MGSIQPQLTNDGVAFTVRVDFVAYDCVVSREALTLLAGLSPDSADPMATFRAYEANINGIARRMVGAGVPSKPLYLGAKNFKFP